jgi:nicotinamide-nucleotide amidase
MIGEIVAIGDELTSGVRLDTNSQWLARQLGDIGVQVLYHTAVGDELAPLSDVITAAAARADVILCTGGLGPTADDLTRDALAQCAGVELVKNDAVLEHIQNMYAQRKRPMPQRNVVQAMFPVGSRVIPNPHGTAPGIDMDLMSNAKRKSRLFALPGVPAEMKEMFVVTVLPAIVAMIPANQRRVIRHRRIKCFGVGESDLEAMLPDLIARDYYPRVGITVSKATITLRITARELNEAECSAVMEPTIATIRGCLGKLAFGEEDDELQHVVGRLLAARQQTLATAEHFTGGMLARWLAAVPEANSVYRGGRLLRGESSHQRGDVERLAADLRDELKADYCLTIGASSPSANDDSIHIALATEGEVVFHTARNIGHPDIRQPRIAKAALDLLRKQLL